MQDYDDLDFSYDSYDRADMARDIAAADYEEWLDNELENDADGKRLLAIAEALADTRVYMKVCRVREACEGVGEPSLDRVWAEYDAGGMHPDDLFRQLDIAVDELIEDIRLSIIEAAQDQADMEDTYRSMMGPL